MNIKEIKEIIFKGESVNVEFKTSENKLPNSIYETYSAFANTNGGFIILGVKEDKAKSEPEERYTMQGVKNPDKLIGDFWNIINSDKVSANIMRHEDVFVVKEDGVSLIIIHVPRADSNFRPVYIDDNPYKGTYKRNHEGDYHASQYEIDGMIRDRSIGGNDCKILKFYTMDDIDKESLKKYRQIFKTRNEDHAWNSFDNKKFLEMLGGYKKDRITGEEGLTVAGLLMFGTGLAFRENFSNIFLDYRDEAFDTSIDFRWQDRIMHDGTWETNLFNFLLKVMPKLLEDLPKPFKLVGIQRVDETSIHKAVREAFVNAIIHSDYSVESGNLVVVKKSGSFEFSNPGVLSLSIEEIYHGGISKTRNPHIQTMLRMIGFGDNAGSGFPTILSVWESEGWERPVLTEDTVQNQITLKLKMKDSSENRQIGTKKSADSSENRQIDRESTKTNLSKRQMQILECMQHDVFYSSEDISALIGLKGSRTRQLLNDLTKKELLECSGSTNRRRYIKKS